MQNGHTNNKNLLIIIISYVAFISLGLPDGLLGIGWPFMSKRLDLPIDYLGILLITFVTGYLSTSLSSGKILTILPLGIILVLSSCITGLSLLLYAYSNYWWLVILASFCLGTGGGAIDASINTFAASKFSPSTINWLHAFYGIGATSGPFLMTWMFVNNYEWFHGYIIVGFIQITLAIVFLFTIKLWKVSSDREEQESSISYNEVFQSPIVWISIIIFFLYTGLEIGVGQWIFSILTKSRNINLEQAGLWTSAYWGSFTAGRIIYGFILTRLSIKRVISFTLLGLIAGTALFAINSNNWLSLISIIIIGFSNAPIFPCMISLTPNLIGSKYTGTIIGFQISAAMIGGGLLPGFAGIMADSYGWEMIPLLFLIEAIILLLLFIIYSKRNSTVLVN